LLLNSAGFLLPAVFIPECNWLATVATTVTKRKLLTDLGLE
jgi:hypothetical protein